MLNSRVFVLTLVLAFLTFINSSFAQNYNDDNDNQPSKKNGNTETCQNYLVQIGYNKVRKQNNEASAYKREAAPETFDEFLEKMTDLFNVDTTKLAMIKRENDQSELVVRLVTDILELLPASSQGKIKRELLENDIRDIVDNMEITPRDIDLEKRLFSLSWLSSFTNNLLCAFGIDSNFSFSFNFGKRDVDSQWITKFAANILGLFGLNTSAAANFSVHKRANDEFTADLVARLYENAIDMFGSPDTQLEMVKRQDYNDFENKLREIIDSGLEPEINLDTRSISFSWFNNIMSSLGCFFGINFSSSGFFGLGRREINSDWFSEFAANVLSIYSTNTKSSSSLDDEKREIELFTKKDFTINTATKLVADLVDFFPTSPNANVKREEIESDIYDFIRELKITQNDIDFEKRSFSISWLNNIITQIGCLFDFNFSSQGWWGLGKREINSQWFAELSANIVGLAGIHADASTNSNLDEREDNEWKREISASVTAKIIRDLYELHQAKDQDVQDLSKRFVDEEIVKVPSSYFTISNVEPVKGDLFKVTLNYEIVAFSQFFENFKEILKSLKLAGIGTFNSEVTLWDNKGISEVDNFAKWSIDVLVRGSKHGQHFCMPDQFAIKFDWTGKPNSVLETVWTEHFDKQYQYTLNQDFQNKSKRSFFQFPLTNKVSEEFDLSKLDAWAAYTTELPNFCWPINCSA